MAKLIIVIRRFGKVLWIEATIASIVAPVVTTSSIIAMCCSVEGMLLDSEKLSETLSQRRNLPRLV